MIASCSSPRLRRAPLLVATGLLAGGAVLPAPALAQRPRNAAPQVDTALYATLDWRLVGPFRGGRSVAVAGVAGQPRTYFFGGVGGGVWKTTD
ncbi:MAG: hypothetical protein KC645_11305, partial [Gemmatimonadetes bacterium]|nr:hypothetical protein [Gemmatimonadota bacterium]